LITALTERTVINLVLLIICSKLLTLSLVLTCIIPRVAVKTSIGAPKPNPKPSPLLFNFCPFNPSGAFGLVTISNEEYVPETPSPAPM